WLQPDGLQLRPRSGETADEFCPRRIGVVEIREIGRQAERRERAESECDLPGDVLGHVKIRHRDEVRLHRPAVAVSRNDCAARRAGWEEPEPPDHYPAVHFELQSLL